MNPLELARQLRRVGALALPLAALGALLAGLAWGWLAPADVASLARRAPRWLGPIAALLLLAAPLGAAHAGELAALREGQQLAWLRASGRSIFAQVVVARVLATGLVGLLAAWIAAAALVGGAALATSRDAALAPLSALGLADLLAGGAYAALGAAALACVGCSIGIASRGGVARSAALGATVCLAIGAGVALALLARGIA